MSDLERELRRVLHDDRLSVEPAPDALDQVHQGARRRLRRRRAAMSGLSAFAVLAVATTAFAATTMNRDGENPTAAGGSGSASPEADKKSAMPLESSASSGSNERTEPSRTGGPVPAGFAAASVTAMSPSAFWVLGTAPCGNPTCTSVVRTTDGGRTFSGLPAPKAPLATGEPTASTVSDMRFASMNDGFAYGGALWSTHDAGRSWSPVDIPGKVVRLESVQQTVWALVRKGDGYRLFRSPASSDDWRRVSLPVTLDDTPADLMLQADTVTVSGGSGGSAVTLVSTDGGKSFESRESPCAAGLGASLSGSAEALWMFCATGTSGRPYVSKNGGLDWRPVPATPPGGWANSTAIGARSGASAVLASGGHVFKVTSGGDIAPAATLGADNVRFRYIGFTTPSVGYAVLARPTTSSLWRTTDGGSSWQPVRYS